MVKSIEWCGTVVRFIDQTKLPFEESYVTTDDVDVLLDAIRSLKIRGAPLIGIAAAYGVCLAANKLKLTDTAEFFSSLKQTINRLAEARPTAVNLFWALKRMEHVASHANSVADIRRRLVEEALKIHQEDKEACRRIGEFGSALIDDSVTILTHCNTGALATGGEGTAQSVITHAHRQGKVKCVFVGETRPMLQGARLTTWELQKMGVKVVLISDTMVGFFMSKKKIDLVVVGADRIAANGDVANKIGTYNLAVLANYHQIPFYVAAPTSTIDVFSPTGESIPIEFRSSSEVREIFGKQIVSPDTETQSPAFDITPSELITAIITETGVVRPPFSLQ